MARPPPIGTPGNIQVVQDSPGAWVARCWFRDHDGVTRRLRKHGSSKTEARNALYDVIRERQRGRGGYGGPELTPASTFAEAAVLYLAKVERKREDSTHALYRFHLDGGNQPAHISLTARRADTPPLTRPRRPTTP